MSEKTDLGSVSAIGAHDVSYEKSESDRSGRVPKLRDAEVESGEIEDSPYEEVRAIVPPVDDPEMPVNTFRAWSLGIVSTFIFSGILQFFQLHSPPIFLSSNLVIIVTLPVGHFMARVLPTKKYNLFRWEFSLNPGPFNYKEHTITSIMTTLVWAFDNGSLASDVYVAFDKFLGIPISPGFKFMFLLTTQALSFGFAGMFHRFLVRPAFCIWPGALPNCSMIYGFHNKNFQNIIANGWKIHRMKFFWLAVLIASCWQVVPSFLFTSLTTFAFITWIRPADVTLNQVFGATSGMDLLPLTLDWNQISGYLSSPLVVPSWAIINILVGSVFFLWIVSPALHWQNVWYGRYFPFSSSGTFDNTGAAYNTTRVMNPDFSINNAAYADYSPVFLSTTSVLSYGLGFASITSILVHTGLYHRSMLWKAFKAAFRRQTDGEEDIHGKLMRAYKGVPEWWYGLIFAAIFGISVAFLYVYDTQLPWWGLIISILINLVLLIPIGLMKAMTNMTINTGALSALIAGFIWPGNLMNNVVFKVFTLVATFQGLAYVQSMKTGHYMKIPPRVTFVAQCLSIVISWVVQTAVNIWAMGNVEGICTREAVNSFTCPLANGYAANAVFWGLIGPTKLFKSGSMYNSMLWFFFVGATLPMVLYLLAKNFPKNNMLKKIHTPVIFASTSSIPPATAANYISWGIVGLVFNMAIKRRYHDWWAKYNYLLSAALDSALAITTFLVFFCLTYPGVTLDWWGNSIASMTADGLEAPLDTVAEGETFGPSSWI
ncbi:OPT superfamily oligopeptide transporter [Xylariaceae sp. FL0662B]|nr:OPT superfamily oligopeptide transporter [Xylariaceae sp. FL0662B]